MPRVGFKPTIPVFERAKTFHALDRAATVIGNHKSNGINSIRLYLSVKYEMGRRKYWRSEWTRGLRHVRSLLLQYWNRGFTYQSGHIYVCVCICGFFCLFCPVYVEPLRRVDPPSKVTNEMFIIIFGRPDPPTPFVCHTRGYVNSMSVKCPWPDLWRRNSHWSSVPVDVLTLQQPNNVYSHLLAFKSLICHWGTYSRLFVFGLDYIYHLAIVPLDFLYPSSAGPSWPHYI
jgi:hypothetical protein